MMLLFFDGNEGNAISPASLPACEDHCSINRKEEIMQGKKTSYSGKPCCCAADLTRLSGNLCGA
ncbi:MAG: hypothetical protein D3914_16180 [Candidatus Electrothrix sp. LOE2]|nr:hypothetical protein [Candidatus Electrothrix sp. LOE2]